MPVQKYKKAVVQSTGLSQSNWSKWTEIASSNPGLWNVGVGDAVPTTYTNAAQVPMNTTHR